jgi:hypothetical protein
MLTEFVRINGVNVQHRNADLEFGGILLFRKAGVQGQ